MWLLVEIYTSTQKQIQVEYTHGICDTKHIIIGGGSRTFWKCFQWEHMYGSATLFKQLCNKLITLIAMFSNTYTIQPIVATEVFQHNTALDN